MKGLVGTLVFLSIALHVQGAPQYSNHGYQGPPSNYIRPMPGYGGNPSNHLRPWGYGGPPSQHTRPYNQDHAMSFGQPISSPGKVMIDSEGNYQSSEMGLYGSASYPSAGNVQVLPRNDMYSGHSGHSGSHYPSSGNVQVLPMNNHGYSGNPSNHLRPWGNSGYGGNPGQHLRPWQGGNKVEVLPMGGGQSLGEDLPPVQQAPLPPMSNSQPMMAQPPMSMSPSPMIMSQPPMSMPQPQMSMYRPPMGMVQPLNWRKSYQPIPGTGNCYNRCKNRCGGSSGFSGYSGCRRPSCSNRCNIQPTCRGRMGSMNQPGNFQVSGNTLLCGTRRQNLQPRSPWIPGYPNPMSPPNPMYPSNPMNPPNPMYPSNPMNPPPFSQAQTLPHPIKFAEVPEDVEGIASGDDEIADEE